jgi:hypothetical protein
MSKITSRKSNSRWLTALLVVGSIYACSGSEEADPGAGSSGKPNGASCADGAECTSGVCNAGACVGNGLGAPSGSPCASNAECASGACEGGECSAGSDLPTGSSCSADGECASSACTDGVCSSGSSGTGGTNGSGTGSGAPGDDCSLGTECQSGLCVSGVCSEGSGSGSGTSTTPGAHFPGSGTGYRPLTTGCGPDTAALCTGECEQMGGDPDVDVLRPPATLCFSGEGDLTPEDPSVVIEQVIEELDGVAYVHLRVTFDPAFVDNTYGEGACCGWSDNRGHTFDGDLTKSDHTELLLTNGDGDTAMHFKVDLITASPDSACGFETLGVTGGDGSVLIGNAEDVLGVATSTSRNINGCGYCESDACAPSGNCTVDSPPTDESYTPNDATPNWDYRQVYEVWIALDAFGDSGFGQGYITYTHASPSKGADTIVVEGTPCPPEWDTPYCPPDVLQEGGNCFGTPPGGEGGSTGSGGGPGTSSECPVNEQLYLATEGAAICTPIPYAGYPDMAACPAGYHLDLASEGRYCLPD